MPLITAMNGRKARSDQRIGSTVASATCVGNCRASDFGTNSPRIACVTARMRSTEISAIERERASSSPKNVTSIGPSATANVAWA